MMEGGSREVARGQSQTAVRGPALAETLGLDRMLLQTAVSATGAAGRPPGGGTSAWFLFPSRVELKA